MSHLRPQIVAAASITPAGDRADPKWTRGRRPRPGRLPSLGVLSLSVLSLWLVASLGAATARSAPPASALRPLEQAIRSEMNALRRQHRVSPLRHSAGLAAAARQHSNDMARRGYFRHSSPAGLSFTRRIARFYPIGSHRYWSVGENLLWSSIALNATAALKLWLESPKHRAMMLGARWQEVGVSAVHVGSAPGIYGGREVTIITADFGVRR
jgi:uncharacterized protein YkwD